jgi:hypothetical protein
METYPHNATCSNCSRPQGYHIPKGTTVSDFIAQQMCKVCGCSMVVKEYKLRSGADMDAMGDKGRVAGL